MSEMPSFNYPSTMVKAKQVINSWKYRYLTPLSKITVIKTLILSKFTHIFMTIPTPLEVLNELNKLFYSYLWGKNPEKISRQQICKPPKNGGLSMINIFNF